VFAQIRHHPLFLVQLLEEGAAKGASVVANVGSRGMRMCAAFSEITEN
jgi:hypothetical protein